MAIKNIKDITIILGCEESQAVTIELRKLGITAFSNDIQPCSGGRPDLHFQMDINKVLKAGKLRTEAGTIVNIKKWMAGIFFPPCTYLSFAGNGYFNISKYGENAIKRWRDRVAAIELFYNLYEAPIEHISIENPMGFPHTAFRPADQIIEPFYFGDDDRKKTCLWLKNLPPLIHSISDTLFDKKTHIAPPDPVYIDASGKKRYKTDSISGTSIKGKKERSKTFPGIARAMATQWSEFLISKYIP